MDGPAQMSDGLQHMAANRLPDDLRSSIHPSSFALIRPSIGRRPQARTSGMTLRSFSYNWGVLSVNTSTAGRGGYRPDASRSDVLTTTIGA